MQSYDRKFIFVSFFRYTFCLDTKSNKKVKAANKFLDLQFLIFSVAYELVPTQLVGTQTTWARLKFPGAKWFGVQKQRNFFSV